MILTIDLGTGGPKVAIFDSSANLVDHEFATTETQHFPDGGAEQDPNEWWRKICECSKKLFARHPDLAEKVSIISTTAQWSGTVCVDAQGQTLHPAIIWMDSRGADAIQKRMRGVINFQGYGISKVIGWLYKTNGAPGQAGKDPTAHIAFIREKKGDLYAKTHKFLEPVDYLVSRLSGKMLASRHTICLHWVYNHRKKKYDDTLLKWAGIDREKLPDIVEPNAVVGECISAAAADLGLKCQPKVNIGSADIMSAAVGSGAVTPGLPHVYVGTSGWLVCHTTSRVIDVDHQVVSLPSAIPGLELLTNEQECAGNALKFLRDRVFSWKENNFFDWLNREAAKIPAGSDGLVFLPWLVGERSPVEDHHLRGAWINLKIGHSQAHVARAVLEGVCLNLNWLKRIVEKDVKMKFDRIHFIGGGAQSELWCQIMASVFGIKVLQIDNPVLANSQGCAFLGALAMNWITINDIPAAVKIKKEFHPEAADCVVYDQQFRHYLAMHKALKPIFHRMN